MTIPVLGNIGAILGGELTEEPFIIMLPTPEQAAMTGAGMMVVALDGSSIVELSIVGGGGGGVIPIAQKFLPEGYPYEFKEINLRETNVDLAYEGEGGLCLGTIQERFETPLVLGETYKINWNGTVYECVATTAEGITVGNVGALTGGEDTGEPFVISYVPEEMADQFGGYGLVLDLTSQENVTVTVSIERGGLTKLDPKYLPMDYIVQEVLANLTNGNEVAY
jgi:hypothetical protein